MIISLVCRRNVLSRQSSLISVLQRNSFYHVQDNRCPKSRVPSKDFLKALCGCSVSFPFSLFSHILLVLHSTFPVRLEGKYLRHSPFPMEGLLSSNGLIGMCRWIDHHGVAFSIELLQWGRTFSGFWIGIGKFWLVGI